MTKLATRRQLSNELRVTTVGTGTCVPRLRRGGPCILLFDVSAPAIPHYLKFLFRDMHIRSYWTCFMNMSL